MRVVKVVTNDEECAAKCEQLMSDIVDLLAGFPNVRLDLRAWNQLLIYYKEKADARR